MKSKVRHYSCSEHELVNNLTRRVLLQKKFKYLRWVERIDATKKFYGIVGEHDFRIVPLFGGRNFLTPVVQGSISPDDKGSMITFQVKPSMDVKMALGFVLVYLLLLFLLVPTGSPVETGEIGMWFFTMIGLAVFAVFLSLNKWFIKKRALPYIERELPFEGVIRP